jgi:hypothetical protein
MVFIPANLQFRDDDYKTIVSTIATSGNYQFPGTGYWVTNNSYANDMRPYWGGWGGAHVRGHGQCQLAGWAPPGLQFFHPQWPGSGRSPGVPSIVHC